MGIFPSYEREKFDPTDQGHLDKPYPVAVPVEPVVAPVEPAPPSTPPIKYIPGWIVLDDGDGSCLAIPIANIHRVVLAQNARDTWIVKIHYKDSDTGPWTYDPRDLKQAREAYLHILDTIREVTRDVHNNRG